MKKVLKLKWRAVAAVVGLGSPLVTASSAFAGSGVSISSNSSGLPGISALETIVGALITIGVVASVAGVVMGAAVWSVGNHSANPQVASRGKSGVLVGAVAAIVCGGALAIVNFFFNVGAGL
jgi:hypothetical protein